MRIWGKRSCSSKGILSIFVFVELGLPVLHSVVVVSGEGSSGLEVVARFEVVTYDVDKAEVVVGHGLVALSIVVYA